MAETGDDVKTAVRSFRNRHLETLLYSALVISVGAMMFSFYFRAMEYKRIAKVTESKLYEVVAMNQNLQKQVKTLESALADERMRNMARNYDTGASKADGLPQADATQDVGITNENAQNYTGPVIMPVSGTISSGFGNRSNPMGGTDGEHHNGLDIAVPQGTDVMASGGGEVAYAGSYGSFGKLVIIDHGDGLLSYYAHNSQLMVKKGETVVMGQVVAKSGNTGRSTGPHLHFEIRLDGKPVDPRDYVV